MRIIKFISFGLLIISSNVGNAQQLLRGPYLQKLTSTSINVRWRTDVAATTKVYYGTDVNNLTQTVSDNTAVTDHDIAITGLQPFTQYFYKIESNGTELMNGGSIADQHFKTAPIPGTVQPIRVWSIGDFGKGNLGEKKVRDSYLQYSQGTHTDVWLWNGDNVYENGTDAEYQERVFDTLYGYGNVFKNMPFFPCPGNHDYNSICPIPCGTDPNQHSGPYYDMVTVPTNGEAGGVPSGLKNYYSYDYGNVHFVSLNSELGSTTASYDWNGVYGADHAANSPMMQWLRADLTANNLPWVIVYWHQCPYTQGSHHSDDFWEIYMKAMRQNIVPVLEEYNVDLVISGHSHVYERSYLIKGHYGTSGTFNSSTMMINSTSGNETLGEAYLKDSIGTVYVVSGNAGSEDSDPEFPYPCMYFSDGGNNIYGSFLMDINDNKLTGKYLTSEGEIKDQFTIIKGEPTGINDSNFFKDVTNVSVSPNPFSSTAKLKYELLKSDNIIVELYALDGKKIHSLFSGKQQAGKQTLEIDAETLGLADGKYILKITNGQKSSFEKIIRIK